MAKLCEPQNMSVLIPYRDLEILMDYAKNYKKMEKDFEALQKRVTALHGLYADVLDQLNKVYQFL